MELVINVAMYVCPFVHMLQLNLWWEFHEILCGFVLQKSAITFRCFIKFDNAVTHAFHEDMYEYAFLRGISSVLCEIQKNFFMWNLAFTH